MRLSLSRTTCNIRSGFGNQNVLRHFLSSSTSRDTLYRRISPVGDPRVSIIPILDQWIQEGRTVRKEELQPIIKELRTYRRFKHALEISQWMTDKRYIPLSCGDIATRLNLILRVHGLEQVENYFKSVPKQLKGFEVYCALLNCYAHEKSLEKAEAIMQEIRDFGFAWSPLCYNILMNLYYQTENHEKLDALMHEMEEKGICCDQYTFSIRLSAYASVSDIKGIDEIVTRMESDPRVVLDWNAYSVAANGYMKVGLVDKALAMLKKMEELIITSKKMKVAFDLLLKMYAGIGKKDELYRIWNLYKKKEDIYNKGYISMISSLLKLDDIEGAEKIFEEWESRKLSYDFRIPNFLIDAYCRKGLLEKSEALINRAKAKGGKPSVDTWYYMASGYLENNQIPNAVETIRKAIAVCPPGWKPSKEILATCLEYLEGKGDVEGADEFIRLLRVEGIFSAAVLDRLLSYIKDGKSQPGKSQPNGVRQMEGDVLVGDGEQYGIPEPRQDCSN